jgi:hypothetical protein
MPAVSFYDLSIIASLCLLALAAHYASNNQALQPMLRAIVSIAAVAQFALFFMTNRHVNGTDAAPVWLLSLPTLALLLNIEKAREIVSTILTTLDSILDLLAVIFFAIVVTPVSFTNKAVSRFISMMKPSEVASDSTANKKSIEHLPRQPNASIFAEQALWQHWLKTRHDCLRKQIFIPSSFPHLISGFVFLAAVFVLLLRMEPLAFLQPNMLFPAWPVDHVLYYNGIELIILAFCGVGVIVSRCSSATFERLSLLRPTKIHLLVAFLLVLLGFTFDAYWAIEISYHVEGQDLATQFAHYTSGSFDSHISLAASISLVAASAILFAVGEEMVIGGALQPVLGVIPSSVLYALLYGQFALAPIFMVKLFCWSVFLGMVRRYTNLTTTLLGHIGFNLTTVALFALSP